MNNTSILLAALAFAVGAGLVAALNRGGGNALLEQKLAAAEQRLAELESQAKTPTAVGRTSPSTTAGTDAGRPSDDKPKSGLSAILEELGKAEETGEEITPEEQFAKLANSREARMLIKGFAGAMTRNADRWIAGEMDKYQSRLDLTDAQAQSIKRRMVAMVEESTKEFQAQLDDPSRSTEEIMESQGEFWRDNEMAIEAMLEEELNEEQFEQFQREQLVERTQRVQRRADRELEAIDSTLDLDETQEDQVFSILVREAPEFDESMQIAGVDSGLPPEATAPDVSKDDAIRSVLTPDQVETYNTQLENGGFGRRRGPWGPQ